ncbi:MAG: hypothetical protein ACE5JE_01030 [Thermoplasmata archaeon]
MGAGGARITFHDAFIEFFLGILEAYTADPVLYLIVLFLYGIATAVFLPFPIELALFVKPENLGIFTIALVIGLSKMVGAGLIFLLGLKVEGPIRYYSARYRILGQFVGYVTRFVRFTGWVGLFILLAIPFLPDTLPIYLYSLFNKQGQLIRGWVFLLVNFVGGTLRALIFFFFVAVLGFQTLSF